MDRASEEPPPFVPGPGGMRWEVRTLATGLEAPWALAILPGGEALISQRGGRLWRRSADGALRPVSGVPAPVAGGQGGLLDVLALPEAVGIRVALSLAARRPNGTIATAVVVGRLMGTDLREVWPLLHAFPGAEEGGVHFAGRLAADGGDGLFVAPGDLGVREWPQAPGATAGRILRVGWDRSPRGGGAWRVGDPVAWSMGHRNLDYNPNKGNHGLRSASGPGFPMVLPERRRCQPNRREIGPAGRSPPAQPLFGL